MLRPILSLKRTEYNGPTNSFGANWPGGSILAARIAVMAFPDTLKVMVRYPPTQVPP